MAILANNRDLKKVINSSIYLTNIKRCNTSKKFKRLLKELLVASAFYTTDEFISLQG